MTCGRVSSWKDRPTFEELADLFEGTTASGAERAYRKAVDKLTQLLVAEDAIHAVRLKQKYKTKRKKKIAAAILSLIHIYFRSLSLCASKLYPSTCIEVDTLV